MEIEELIIVQRLGNTVRYLLNEMKQYCDEREIFYLDCCIDNLDRCVNECKEVFDWSHQVNVYQLWI